MMRILNSETLNEIFSTASPVRVEVKEEKRATRYETETGAIRSDHVIDMPLELLVDFMLTGGEMAKDTYADLFAAYEARTLVVVETHMGIYTDMLIEAMPHAETFGDATVNVRFLRWIEVEPEYGELIPKKVRDPEHADTKEGGTRAERVPEKKRSLLHKMLGGKL